MNKFYNYFTKYKEYINTFIFLILVLTTVKILWDYFVDLNDEQVFSIIKSYFEVYGLWLVFFSGILESLLLIGNYFPGSMVIFLGVSFNSYSIINTVLVVSIVTLSMFIGYNINYFLGRHGWSKLLTKFGLTNSLNKVKNKIETKKNKSFTLYIMPATGSLVSTSFGILNFSYFDFIKYMLPSIIFWNFLWGLLVYLFGMKVFEFIANPYVLVPLIIIFVVMLVKK